MVISRHYIVLIYINCLHTLSLNCYLLPIFTNIHLNLKYEIKQLTQSLRVDEIKESFDRLGNGC